MSQGHAYPYPELWTVEELVRLKAQARLMGGDLDALAAWMGDRTRRDVNLALDALAGRTPEAAYAALAARGLAAPEPTIFVEEAAPPTGALRRFFERMFA